MRRAALPVAVALVVVASVVAALVLRGDDRDDVADAIGIAEDASRFESSADASDAFALIASVLIDDARACASARSVEHPRCIALSEGAAYAQSIAVAAMTCTGPAVFEMRTRTVEYLRAIERVGDVPDARRPPLADIPSCS